MTRDQLIEELQRCPYNNEVKVRLTVHPDYFDGVGPAECPVVDLLIFGLTAIPEILIDCEAKP